MNKFEGKKLLIIGGAYQHKRLVELAKEMGIITYVIDYLPVEKSPAKQIADFHFQYDITDYGNILKLCKDEKIDGIISTNLDACQKPYQHICEELHLPCFANREQYQIYTDKNCFKEFCEQNGLDVIPKYDNECFNSKKKCCEIVDFPVLVKPAISRGSRGQTICHSYEEIEAAISFAKEFSSNNEVVIEKYMGNDNDFSVAPLTINGKVYIERTSDRYLGTGKMDKSAVLSIQPSKKSDRFERIVRPKLEKALHKLGVYVTPMMMQGFFVGDKVYFYDPGIRFGGFEYERLYERVNGLDPRTLLIEYALTGTVNEDDRIDIITDGYKMKGKKVCIMYIPILPGVIKRIVGVDEIKNNPKVINFNQYYFEGDTIGEHYNVKQRFCEINFICNDEVDVKNTVDWIYNTLLIYGNDDSQMIFSKLDTSKILK